MWRRPKSELTRSEIGEREAAFDAALNKLLESLRGVSERTARSAVADLFSNHGKTLSEPELQGFAVEGIDPDWVQSQPERAVTLTRELEEEATRVGKPWERD